MIGALSWPRPESLGIPRCHHREGPRLAVLAAARRRQGRGSGGSGDDFAWLRMVTGHEVVLWPLAARLVWTIWPPSF